VPLAGRVRNKIQMSLMKNTLSRTLGAIDFLFLIE
jgi:hypothetical protein